jgi:hypothetical protein
MSAIIQEGGVDAGYKFYRDLMKPKVADVDSSELVESSDTALDTIGEMPVDVHMFNCLLDALYNHGRYRQ